MKAEKNNIREGDFWHSNAPLTSKRVSKILSNPVNSERLVTAVRDSRCGKIVSKGEKPRGIFTIARKG